jgi:prophage maintenance system killer protein
MALFDTLGFQWNRDSVPREVPRASLERVVFRFRRMLPEYVWDAGVLEGNPFTFPEVKTLLEGVTVGGRKLSDQEQILNLAESSKYLVDLVKNREFKLGKSTFCSLHALVARNEALEWGHFRGEGLETQFTPDVALGERGRFTPLATKRGAVRLNEVFASGISSLEQDVSNPFERATAFFLFGSLQQFFFDGNKRTSRFMMNGVLMSEGIDAISIPAVRATEFNTRMVDFYTSRDATEMMRFVLDCHPEISQIRQLNPGLSAVRDLPDIKYFGLNDSMQQTNHDAHSSDRGASADLDTMPVGKQHTQALSLEDTRRQARENWRRNYHDKRVNQLEPRTDSNQAEEHAEEKRSQPERDASLDFDPER